MLVARNSIALLELSSIASGFQAADAMLKAADVELLVSRTICSGKYIVLVAGDVAGARASLDAGESAVSGMMVDSCLIPNLHPDIFPAISGTAAADSLDALGVIESFSVAALIEGADAAVKAADVHLLEIRLAMALGGKSFVTLTGNVAAVQAAIDAGSAAVASKGMLVNRVVIPAPRRELARDLV